MTTPIETATGVMTASSTPREPATDDHADRDRHGCDDREQHPDEDGVSRIDTDVAARNVPVPVMGVDVLADGDDENRPELRPENGEPRFHAALHQPPSREHGGPHDNGEDAPPEKGRGLPGLLFCFHSKPSLRAMPGACGWQCASSAYRVTSVMVFDSMVVINRWILRQ
jgi:hypothetical protein